MTTNPATPAPAEALDHDWIDRHAILSAQVPDNVTVLLASSVRRAVDDWITRSLATLAAQGTQAAEPDNEELARLGWQRVICPACGCDGARGYPRPAASPSRQAEPRSPLTEDRIRRLQDAIEGECDGLAISPEHARAILEWVDGIGANGGKPAGATGAGEGERT